MPRARALRSPTAPENPPPIPRSGPSAGGNLPPIPRSRREIPKKPPPDLLMLRQIPRNLPPIPRSKQYIPRIIPPAPPIRRARIQNLPRHLRNLRDQTRFQTGQAIKLRHPGLVTSAQDPFDPWNGQQSLHCYYLRLGSPRCRTRSRWAPGRLARAVQTAPFLVGAAMEVRP